MDRKFVIAGFVFAIIGMMLGLYMAASTNHQQFVTHAHIMLIGFLLSFVYGLCHKLWLNNIKNTLATIQFYAHLLGATFVSIGLFLLYGKFVAIEIVDPVLALASFTVFAALILMLILFLKAPARS